MSSPPCAAGMWPLHTPSAVQGWNPFDSTWWDEFMGAPVDTMMETVKDSVSSFKKKYAALKPPLENSPLFSWRAPHDTAPAGRVTRVR